MVYLICFDQHYKHARHYIGFTDNNLEDRIESHRKGTGARLLKVINEAGIGWNVVRTWEKGDRKFERQLKNRKNSKQLCPICGKK